MENKSKKFLFMKGVAKMKKGNLLEGILFILGGIILLSVALLTDSVLDSLLIGFAAGAICSGTVMTCKYFYWNTSKNKERYQEKIENEKIELHDELKSQLRDKSGRYAYAIGLMTVSISIIIFSILGKLEVIDNADCFLFHGILEAATEKYTVCRTVQKISDKNIEFHTLSTLPCYTMLEEVLQWQHY